MSSDVAADRVDRALALCDLGRLDDAEAALRGALAADPGDPLAHALLALVLVDLDRGEEAVGYAQTAVALAPDIPPGHVAEARALLSLERFKAAEAPAREAIRLDPEDADAHVVLAAVLAGRGRWDEALAAADEALSLQPESEEAQGLRAVALAMSPNGQGWEEAVGGTLAAAADSSTAHALAGYAHLARGGEREAVERFREALRLDPESDAAREGLAEAMKASHPLFRPLFRFFMWQERLSRGAKVAVTFGPLVALWFVDQEAATSGPGLLVSALIAAWFLFVALTWASVPLANLALRSLSVGRAVLPAEQKRSSSVFLALVAACLLSLGLTVTVDSGFFGTAFTTGLLAFPAGSLHALGPRLRRAAYGVVVALAVAAYVGGALLALGVEEAGAVILLVSFLGAAVMLWVVRLG